MNKDTKEYAVIGYISLILALLGSLHENDFLYMIGAIIGKGIVYFAFLWLGWQGFLWIKKKPQKKARV